MPKTPKRRRLPMVVPPNTATPEQLARALLRPLRRPDGGDYLKADAKTKDAAESQ